MLSTLVARVEFPAGLSNDLIKAAWDALLPFAIAADLREKGPDPRRNYAITIEAGALAAVQKAVVPSIVLFALI